MSELTLARRLGLERGTCIYCKTEGDREIPHLNAPDNEEPNNPPMEDDEENNNPSLDDNDGEQDSDTTDEQVGFFGKIANFFKNLFQKIASLFKRKK